MSNIYTSQNVLVSTNNKDSEINLNNDLYIRFPNTLYIKDIAYLSLLDFNMNGEISLFGNSNSSLILEYKNNNGTIINQPVHIDFSEISITDDNMLSTFLTDTLNALILDNYNCTFNVSQSYVISVITNFNPEVDLSTTTYTITTSSPMSFYFNLSSSIGPLLGFGTGIYLNKTTISGNSTMSMSAYNFITCINDSAISGVNPNYDDLNCKMILYDSNNQVIQNSIYIGDATISINPSQQKLYQDIGTILTDIENAMNTYSNRFSPLLTFQYHTIIKQIK